MQEEGGQSSRDEVMEQLKALGYIDPGAGSSMWQITLGSFFLLAGRVKSVFGKSSQVQDSEDEES